VLAKVRELPVTDAFTQKGTLRMDGQMVHDMYLVRVKNHPSNKYPGTITMFCLFQATTPSDRSNKASAQFERTDVAYARTIVEGRDLLRVTSRSALQ
jgi:hypothetical protein